MLYDNSHVSFKEAKFTLIAADVSGPMTPSTADFPVLLFVVRVDYDVS